MAYIRFDPSDVESSLLRDREDDREAIEEQLSGYLEDIRNEPTQTNRRCAVLVQGEKGVGKSILVGAVLDTLRAAWSSTTLFLQVDCRNLDGVRAVVQKIAVAVQLELAELDRILEGGGGRIKPGLKRQADLLVEITRYEDTEFAVVQETMKRFEEGLRLAGGLRFLKFLDTSFGLSMTEESKTLATLRGRTRFDIPRLAQMLKAFLLDIREAGYAIILWLDNIDELRHQYSTEGQRATVRDEAKWVLDLYEGPIGLVACMRSYFVTGIVPRQIDNRPRLGPLSSKTLLEVLQARISRERDNTAARLRQQAFVDQFKQLADIAPTPLAFLTWCKWIARIDNPELGWRELAVEWYKSNYSTLDANALSALRRCFGDAGREAAGRRVALDSLIEAAGGELRFNQLVDCQAVLPVDFWNPVEFTVDPTLVWLLS